MNSVIELVGGKNRASEILEYQMKYFQNFRFYDVKRKMFSKNIDQNRINDFIPVRNIASELKGSENV